jgi:hypothetical protein
MAYLVFKEEVYAQKAGDMLRYFFLNNGRSWFLFDDMKWFVV